MKQPPVNYERQIHFSTSYRKKAAAIRSTNYETDPHQNHSRRMQLSTIKVMRLHFMPSSHNVKDFPGRTGDSGRIRATGETINAFLIGSPRPLPKASGSAGEILNDTPYNTLLKSRISFNYAQCHPLLSRTSLFVSRSSISSYFRNRYDMTFCAHKNAASAINSRLCGR